ncbi:MAG: class I tRNA ligase family protein, partial [Candidatus Aenigmatarchaeota archaeon]
DGWNMADDVVASAFLLAKDIKFSKSRGKGIDLESALDMADTRYWRYVLMSSYPRDDDITFSLDIFRDRVNNELNDSYGNFVHRVLKFLQDNFDGEVPEVETDDGEIIEEVHNIVDDIQSSYSDYDFKEASSKIMKLSSLGNQYFQENEPWETVDSDPEDCEKVLKTCTNIVKSLAIVSEPIVPCVAEEVWEYLGMNTDIHEERWENAKKFDLSGKEINEPEPLFEKIDDEEFEKIKREYSVSDDDEKEGFGNENSKPENKKVSGGEESMISFDEFQELDLRVGKIQKVEEIENADELYRIQIDVGQETKQSVAGLKKTHSKDDLEGRKVPVIVNLEPAELMGEKSECMILAADEDGKPVLFDPEKDVEAGTDIR